MNSGTMYIHMRQGHILLLKTITTVSEGTDLPQLNSRVDFIIYLL